MGTESRKSMRRVYVNPGFTCQYGRVYEVAGDSKGLKLEILGGGTLGTEAQALIDLGI